jgi:spore coat protein H
VPELGQPFKLPPVQQSVQEYELLVAPEVLALFDQDPYTPEQDAVFRHAGVDYPVKIRLRGASARFFPKKSWNVSFESARFEGRTALNLVAEYADATMLAEKLSYDVLAAMRVPAPHTKYVRLLINGQYMGVFLDIEQVNKAFLRAHAFADRDATIYRTGWKDNEFKTWKVPYQGDWNKRTNEKTTTDEPLWEVLRVINHTPEPMLPQVLAQHMDLEGFLRSMTLDVLMANNYVEDSESYFIHDKVAGRWVYVPWDLNNVDARWWYPIPVEDARPIYRHPLFPFTLTDSWVDKRYVERKTVHPGYLPVFSNLGTRVIMHPELRARLLARLDKALEELFTEQVMGAHIDALHALIAPHMAQEPPMPPDDKRLERFQAGRAFMKDFVRLRRAHILSELQRHQAQTQGLVLEAVDARAGWVELRNRGQVPVSTEGLVLTTNLRRSIPELLEVEDSQTPGVFIRYGAFLPPHTLAPGARLRIHAADLGLAFALNGELGLFTGQSVTGMKDLLFYGQLPEGKYYMRTNDTAGRWEVR